MKDFFKVFLSVEDSDNIIIVANQEYPNLSFDELARITCSTIMPPDLAVQWATKLRVLADRLEQDA